MNFLADDVAAWIHAGEGRELEFKRGLPQPERTARVLCAFANTRGGVLLIGVTDQGRVWGVPRPEDVSEALLDLGEHVVDPPMDLRVGTVELEGLYVVACSVPLSPSRPHRVLRVDGVREVVVRVGSSNRVADGATLRAISERPSRKAFTDLERRALDWIRANSRHGAGPDAGATVSSFARSHNVGKQRARRAFLVLERAGCVIGHGQGARRVYGIV